MNFDVLGTKITTCAWDKELVINGRRSYDQPIVVFFGARHINGPKDIVGHEMLCIEKYEKGYRIRYRDIDEMTYLEADSYEAVINN